MFKQSSLEALLRKGQKENKEVSNNDLKEAPKLNPQLKRPVESTIQMKKNFNEAHKIKTICSEGQTSGFKLPFFHFHKDLKITLVRKSQ